VTPDRSGPDLAGAGFWGASLLTLRFLTELATLAALAVAGARADTALAGRIVLAVLGPVLVAVIWGLAIGPRAARRPADPWRLMIEIVIFVASAVALGLVGYGVVAVVYAAIAIVTAGLVRLVTPGS
jgi:hypothetical protein